MFTCAFCYFGVEPAIFILKLQYEIHFTRHFLAIANETNRSKYLCRCGTKKTQLQVDCQETQTKSEVVQA